MRKFTFRFIVALLTFLVGISAGMLWLAYRSRHTQGPAGSHLVDTSKATQPAEGKWQKITGPGFTFYLPSDMKQAYAACIHTYCQRFSNGEMEIKISYGTAYELTPNTGYVAKYQPEYQELKTEIDGRKAEMSTHYDDAYIFKYIAWVHFPDVGDGKTHLSMKAVCNEQHDLEMARQAFSTVEFP